MAELEEKNLIPECKHQLTACSTRIYRAAGGFELRLLDKTGSGD
jgi:hypothetical protein